MSMSKMTRNVLVSMICLPLAACMTEGEEPGAEDLSTTESPLCSDGAADAVVSFVDAGGQSGAVSALATNNYDHPACSDRFTVEITGVSSATQPFSAYGG